MRSSPSPNKSIEELREQVKPNGDDLRWVCKSCGYLYTTEVTECVECGSTNISKKKRKNVKQKYLNQNTQSMFSQVVSWVPNSLIALGISTVIAFIFILTVFQYNLYSKLYVQIIGSFILVCVIGSGILWTLYRRNMD